MRLRKAEWAVLVFTLAYVAGFGLYFLAIGNREFLWYIATMLALMALVAQGARRADFPAPLLWLLSIWGLAHMAGGGFVVGEGVLYSHRLLDIVGSGERAILKYDQLVHFYGFGVAALVLRHLLLRNHPSLKASRSLWAYPILGAMGLGALNEMIEFAAVLALPDTNVGGYYNTGLDLLFNAGGAVAAMWLVSVFERKG